MIRKSKLLTITSIIIVFSMIFAACGNNIKDTNNIPTASPTDSIQPTDSKNDSQKLFSDQPTDELTVMFLSWVPEPPDLPMVQDELNKILKDKINTTVRLLPVAGGDYLQRMNIMIAGGEECDIFLTGTGLQYYIQAASGQLKPIDDLLESYGQGIKSEVGDRFLDITRSIDGKAYAVPSLRCYAGQTSFIMRKDLIEKYNIDLSNVKEMADLTPILKTIKENEPGVTPVIPENPNPGDGIFGLGIDVLYDPLGDTRGVLPNYGQDTKVENLYETEGYKKYVYTLRDWYLNNYIASDVAVNRETAADLIKAGRGFGHFSGAGTVPGNIELVSNQYGTPMVAVGLGEMYVSGGNITQIMWAIPNHSTKPERAMAFLNLTYTDSEVLNLIDFGIENKHYVKVSDTTIKFPDGVDAMNHPYFFNATWMWGNMFKSYIQEPQPSNVWEISRQMNDNSLLSKATGFTPNLESLTSESAAVLDVTMQYRPGLETGSVDPDIYLPEFIQKTKEAGIDKIISEKQRQLDEWLASKPN